MTNYNLDRSYSETLHQLQTTDRAHADTFNPLFNQLLNNDTHHNDRLNGHDLQLADIATNIDNFPRQSGETDDSGSFTRALNNLPSNGGRIIIPHGKTYTGNFLINRSNVRITGGGTLKGIIQLYGLDTTGVSRFTGTGDVYIEDITIDGETTRNGITIKWFYGVTISNVKFIHCLKAVNFEPIPQSQHSSRFTITDNRFIENNYCLYVDYDSNITSNGGTYGVGDITFSDNVCEARTGTMANIYHIWSKGLDGLVCEGNTFFFGHTGQEQTNIHIEIFNWIHIEGNQLFEPPSHAMHVINGSNLIIKSNNIAWSGKESIFIDTVSTVDVSHNNIIWKDDNSVLANRTGILVQNCPWFIGSISSNNMYFPNEYAISLISSSYININGNTARNKYATGEAIHFDSLSACGDINIVGNQFTGYSVRLKTIIAGKPSSSTINYIGNDEGVAGNILNGVVSPTFKSYTGNQTTIDMSDSSLIVFANTSPTTITSLTSEVLSSALPREVRLYSYNNNTSISTSIANVTLQGSGSSLLIPSGGSITLLVYGGSILEISRSFPTNRVKTISDTSATQDMNAYDQINFNQPSAITFTGITGTFAEGRIVDFVGFNGNTTIANTVANLKGAVNVVLPNKGLLRLKYTSGAWYEISRNF